MTLQPDVSAYLYPADRHGLVRRPALLAAGFTDSQVAGAVRSGDLVRLVRGIYVPRTTVDQRDPAAVAEARSELYRLRSIAAVTGEREPGAAVLSHQSAGALLGLPMLKPQFQRVHLTNGEVGGGQLRTTTHLHAGELAPGDVVDVDGIAVTSPARTAADLAQATPAEDPLAFARALTVFDGALRRGVPREALAVELHGRRRRGTRTARDALDFADGLSESVGESWGRAQLIVGGLPLPRLQVEYAVEGFDYRLDYDWDGVLGLEFDGFSKYGRLRRPGETVADAVLREKQREDRLRRAGIMVVRAWWSMLEAGTLVPMVADWLDHFRLR